MEESSNQKQTLPGLADVKDADIVVTMLKGYIVCLSKKSNTCFLTQKLFTMCSERCKWRMIEEVMPQVVSLASHKRGNYFVSLMIKFLRNQAPTSNSAWCSLIDNFVGMHEPKNIHVFHQLATHVHSSFVLKRFVQGCDVATKHYIYDALCRSGHFQQLQQDQNAKFVVQQLFH
jgi:hypothetical protein